MQSFVSVYNLKNLCEAGEASCNVGRFTQLNISVVCTGFVNLDKPCKGVLIEMGGDQ